MNILNIWAVSGFQIIDMVIGAFPSPEHVNGVSRRLSDNANGTTRNVYIKPIISLHNGRLKRVIDIKILIFIMNHTHFLNKYISFKWYAPHTYLGLNFG